MTTFKFRNTNDVQFSNVDYNLILHVSFGLIVQLVCHICELNCSHFFLILSLITALQSVFQRHSSFTSRSLEEKNGTKIQAPENPFSAVQWRGHVCRTQRHSGQRRLNQSYQKVDAFRLLKTLYFNCCLKNRVQNTQNRCIISFTSLHVLLSLLRPEQVDRQAMIWASAL